MLYRFMLSVLCSLLVTSATFAEPAPLTLLDPAPVPLAGALPLMDQCEEESPAPDGGFWLPGPEEIQQFEDDLQRHFAADPWSFESDPPPAFIGRYVSFKRGSSTYIFASYLPDYMVKGIEEDALRIGVEKEVLIGGMVVCDGGPDNWEIVYNPETRTFGAPTFHGGW